MSLSLDCTTHVYVPSQCWPKFVIVKMDLVALFVVSTVWELLSIGLLFRIQYTRGQASVDKQMISFVPHTRVTCVWFLYMPLFGWEVKCTGFFVCTEYLGVGVPSSSHWYLMFELTVQLHANLSWWLLPQVLVPACEGGREKGERERKWERVHVVYMDSPLKLHGKPPGSRSSVTTRPTHSS